MYGITLLDIILGLIFLYFIVKGFKRGLIKQTSTILGLVVALYISINQYQRFQLFLEPYLDVSPPVLQFISFAALFIGCNVVIHILGLALKNVIDFLFLEPLDYIAGGAVGLIKGAVLAYLTVLILTKIPLDSLQGALQHSILAQNLLDLTPFIHSNLKHIFEQ